VVSDGAIALLKTINKKSGDGSVILASDMRVARRFTSGSLMLDVALGGGWPANHWVEIFGKESHGKTFVTLKTIAANQLENPEFTTLWIAAEHFDTEQAQALGVDLERVLVVPTQQMEFAYQTMLEFAKSREVDCIVLDSYPALIADEEAAKDMDEATMALGARLTGKFFRKAGSATRRSTLVDNDRPMLGIIINQQRADIGGYSPHGTPQTTPGGVAKNYAFYVRCQVVRGEWIKEKIPGKGEVKAGQQIKITTVKNKSAPPQQLAVIDAYFRDAPELGFKRGDYDSVKELFALASVYDVLERKSSSYSFGGQKWIGKDAVYAALYGDLTLRAELSEAVRVEARRPRQDRPDEEAFDEAAA
jgi:recombination protein RecA